VSCTVHCSVPSRCLADFVELHILASAHGVAVAVAAAAVDASAVAVPVAAPVHFGFCWSFSARKPRNGLR